MPLKLTVANVNDFPQILGLIGSSVIENDVGAKIGQIVSFDPDLKDTLVYSVSDNRFVFNDGVLYLKSSTFVDFESQSQIELAITATDNGTPRLSTSKTFTVMVKDANEFFPTFATQDLFIPFNRVNNQLLGIVKAIDLDTQEIVKYELQQDDAGIFQIASDSGELRLKPGAQVTERSYRIFIGARDNGEPSNSRVVLFNVAVEIPNRFPPTLVSGRNLAVAENSAPQTSVGRILGSDADGDTELRYTTTSRLFNINPITGLVTVASGTQLNFETQSTYVISVDITDSVAPPRTSSHPVTISLENVNDPPNAIRLVDVQVPTLQKGILLSQFVVTDEDPSSQYFYTTSDPRFEIRNEKLALRSNEFLAPALAGTVATVNISVTDSNLPGTSVNLPLSLNIVNNPFPWQNRKSSLDVNTDGSITAFDALLVINALNSPTIGKGPLTTPREFDQLALFYLDTSGDNSLSALDALLVINKLNSKPSGEGEMAKPPSADPAAPPVIAAETWFDAFTALENERRRRS